MKIEARRLSNLIQKFRENIFFKRLITVLGIDVLVKLSGILLLPIYLRLMTQEEYGLYSYLLSIILTFSLVLNFGLYIPLSKFYHDHTNDADKGKLLFTIFMLLVTALFCIIFPIYLFGIDRHIIRLLFKNPIDYNSYRATILLAVIVSVFSFMLTNFFYTSEKIRHVKHYNIWRIICINFFALLLLYLMKGDNVKTRLAATYITELVLFIIFSYFYYRETASRIDRRLALSALKLALPVMFSAILGIIINFGDKFFLEKYGSFKDLSTYYLGFTCASVIPLIFTSLQNAWLPIFFKEKDISKNISKTDKLLVWLFVGFLLLSACIVLFIKIILMLGIIQPKYDPVMYVLPLQLLSQIIASLVPLYSNYLVYFEKTYVTVIVGVGICLVSLIMNILLVPAFGVYGAASVSLISNLLYLLVYYFIITSYKKRYTPAAYSVTEP